MARLNLLMTTLSQQQLKSIWAFVYILLYLGTMTLCRLTPAGLIAIRYNLVVELLGLYKRPAGVSRHKFIVPRYNTYTKAQIILSCC